MGGELCFSLGRASGEGQKSRWFGVVFAAFALFGCSSRDDDATKQVSASAASAASNPACTNASYSGHEYLFCNEALDFGEAEEACDDEGARLVRIESVGEEAFVSARAQARSWLAVVSPAHDGTWLWSGTDTVLWTGGSQGSPSPGAYYAWGAGQPVVDGNFACATFEPQSGTWSAADCDSAATYVCEKDTSSTPEAPPGAQCTKERRAGHDYWFCEDGATFGEASSRCRGVGMDLVTLDDGNENDFVADRVRSESYLGLTDREYEGVWKWSAGGLAAWCGDGGGKTPRDGVLARWENGEPSTDRCRYEVRAGRGYWFCSEHVSAAVAREACESVQSSLARVDNAEENAFLAQRMHEAAWLGADDAAVEGTWAWHEGRTRFWVDGPVASVYANWKPQQPSGGAVSNCLALDAAGSWVASSCTEARAFVCEAAAIPPTAHPPDKPGPRTHFRTRGYSHGLGGDPPGPDTQDCAVISERNERWGSVGCESRHGYVCESLGADAYSDLDRVARTIREDVRTGMPRVSDVAMRDNVAVKDPFTRNAARLGLRECADELEPREPARALEALGLEAIEYRQTYMGIPVEGRGYMVHREPATGFVRSFTGTIEHGIDIDFTPALSERRAFEKVQDALAATTRTPHTRPSLPGVQGELMVFPKSQGRDPLWELAYYFVVPAGATWQPQVFAISAQTGAVLMNVPTAKQQCTSETLPATRVMEPVDITILTLQQNRYGDRPTARASRLESPTNPLLLYTSSLGSGPQLSLGPEIYTECPGEDFPQVAVLDQQGISVNIESPDAYIGGAFQMALQRCLEYYANTFERVSGIPWLGLDGRGQEPVVISMFRDTKNIGPFYAPEDKKIYFTPDVFPFMGAAIEVACHEFTHGFWDHVAIDRVHTNAEMGSVDEGIADTFGNAAEMFVRGPTDLGRWCEGGDDVLDASCLRDAQDPGRSTTFNCRVQSANGAELYARCPKDYMGPDYCTLRACGVDETRDCCTAHRNSTVVSHWAYIAANGAQGTNAASCPYQAFPVDDDVITAVNKTALTLFQGARDQRATFAGYPDLAEATKTAARERFGADSRELRAISTAWFAVNVVEENFIEADLPKVTPARASQDVYPWTTFTWPANLDTAWDLQISTGAFDAGPVLFEKSNITTTVFRDGETLGKFEVSLPFDTEQQYFWRVRPHTTGAWVDCYAIHWFRKTTAPDPIRDFKVVSRFAADGRVRPGQVFFGWDEVREAKSYKLWFSKDRAPDCRSGTGIEEKTFTSEIGIVDGIQPETHYFASLRAVGPNDFDGVPSENGCVPLTFDTAKMSPPTITWPPTEGTHYGYHLGRGLFDPVITWTNDEGSERTRFEFFEIREDRETCETTRAARRTLVDDETRFYCERDYSPPRPCGRAIDLDTDLFPVPNGTGYCFKAFSIAENDRESEPAVGKIRFIHQPAVRVAPGLDVGEWLVENAPSGALADDSHGKDITFEWTGDSDTVGYGFKLGKWPFFVTDAQDPPNCLGPAGDNPPPDVIDACWETPREINFSRPSTDPIRDTSIRLDGDVAANGRYCWAVWPVLRDPENPDEVWNRQPRVSLGDYNCYTTGPSKPTIECDEAPAEFTRQPIACTVHYDYIPDRQFEINVDGITDEVIEVQELCEPDPDLTLYFRDIYDCYVKFTIEPKPHASYLVHAKAWNSDVRSPTEFGTPVWDETFPIVTAECGRHDEVCCDGRCDENLSCEFADHGPRTCQCGVLRAACCDGTTCDEGDCINGECQKCEANFDECCFDGENLYCNGSTLGCDPDSHLCERCGVEDGPCCRGDECNGDRLFCLEEKCVKGCGGGGMVCCSGSSPCDAGFACNPSNNVCVDEAEICGTLGNPCCTRSTACQSGLSCSGNVCTEEDCETPEAVRLTVGHPVGTTYNPTQNGCPDPGTVDQIHNLIWLAAAHAESYKVGLVTAVNQQGVQLHETTGNTFAMATAPATDICGNSIAIVKGVNACGEDGDVDINTSVHYFRWKP